MASRELIVERLKGLGGLVKVYWSDSPNVNVWVGQEDQFRAVLELYKDTDHASTNLGKLFGFPIVYK